MADSIEPILRSVYMERPCQVLPNALWKTLAALPEMRSEVEADSGRILQLEIWDGTRLLCFWARDRDPGAFPKEKYGDLDLMLVHEDYFAAVSTGQFQDPKAFFRLEYSGPAISGPPPGFLFRTADPGAEFEEIAEFLNRCYERGCWDAAAVQGWTSRSVYDPALWVWVEDGEGRPVGLGIGELDRSVPEGSLEWVQVLPEFRRSGYGRALVGELVRRMLPYAGLLTVSGEVHSASHPERLYRSCGFQGKDVWWMLTRKFS